MNNIPDPERPTGDPRTKSMRNEGWAIETGDYARVGPHEGGTRRKGCMAFLGEAKGVSRQLRRLRSPLPLPLIRMVRDPGYSFVSDQMLLTPVYHCISLFQSACRSLSETFGDILGLTTAELKLAGILPAKKTWRNCKRFWFFLLLFWPLN